jgi:cytochrome P450
MATSPRLTDPDFLECPYSRYLELLETTPVVEADGVGVAVLGYENLVALAKDTEGFSRQIDAERGRRLLGIGSNPVGEEVEELLATAHPEVPALFTADPPVHTRHRKLANQAFLPRRVNAMQPAIRELADELIDGFAADGEVDFMRRFAVPLPLALISDILGVGREDMWTLKGWTDDFIAGIAQVLTDEQRLKVVRSVLEFQQYFRPLIEDRREHAREDLLSYLVNARLEDGSGLELEELFPIIAQLVAAGHETTTNFMGNAIVILLRDADLERQLRADPGLIPAFLEEVLRIDPPLHSTIRRATRDVELCGTPIEDGQMVLPVWASGNWDPATFEEPDRFKLGRPGARKHLSFGYGAHYCLGSELARMDVRIAFETLLARFPRMELDEERSDLSRQPGFAHNGYKRIVLRLESA